MLTVGEIRIDELKQSIEVAWVRGGLCGVRYRPAGKVYTFHARIIEAIYADVLVSAVSWS